MLLVLLPKAYKFSSILVQVGAFTVHVTLLPVSFEHVAFAVDTPAVSITKVVPPHALVHSAVWPNLNSVALTLAFYVHLAQVLFSILQLYGLVVVSLGVLDNFWHFKRTEHLVTECEHRVNLVRHFVYFFYFPESLLDRRSAE